MKFISWLLWSVCVLCSAAGMAATPAQGVVYHDANKNAVFDADETGVPGVCISNGRDVVVTDAEGRYTVAVGEDTGLFVIKPAQWTTPVSAEQLPQHYYLHKPAGSPTLKPAGVAPTGPLPEQVNFPLYPHEESDAFRVILFGDPQARGLKEVNFVLHDVVDELIGSNAAFGISLGDMVADDPALFSELSQGIAQIGIPWHNVFGNHDFNRGVQDNLYSDETFERFFGPSTYAFEYGNVAFINFKNLVFNGEGKYRIRFTDDQLSFVESYLKQVPQEKLVVLLMHAPIVDCANRRDMYALIQDRPHTLSLAGHTHELAHIFIDRHMGWRGDKPHHLYVNGTVCGSWWCGNIDERGIPHATMNDGVPNGYAFVDFDGADYKITWKAARRPADYQMHIYLPDDIPQKRIDTTELLVNVFCGSDRSTVEMCIDQEGGWIPLQQTRTTDPECERMNKLNKYRNENVFGYNMDEAHDTTHIWKGSLPSSLTPGSHHVSVRTTDMFGQCWTAHRVFRVR